MRCVWGVIAATGKICKMPVWPASGERRLCVGHSAQVTDDADLAAAACAEQARRLSGEGRPDDARDPVRWVGRALGLAPWLHQVRALEAIRDHRRVSWRSCHGAGKSTTAASAALWFTLTQPDSLTVITAPSARQVRQVLWREIKRLACRAPRKLADSTPGDIPELGWSPSPDRLLLGLTSDSAERFVGLHARRVLVIVDEASGVPQPIFEAVKGLLTGDSRLLLISNPSQTSGEFFDSHHRKASLYARLHTSADDVIREAGDTPGLIDAQYVRELIEDYGETSATVAIKVRGEFPTEGADNVIPFSLVEAARGRWSPSAFADSAEPLTLGVDPARFGDDLSCVVAVRGLAALEPLTFSRLDGVQLAARVMEIARRLSRTGEVVAVRVDSIGVGASVVDQLGQLNRGEIAIEPVNVGESATVDTFERLRDQLWFGLRDWIKAGGALPPDERLCGELIAPTFGFSPRGRQKVEPKEATKVRLRRSPDRADALALAVFRSVGPTGIDAWSPALFVGVDGEELDHALAELGARW